MHYLPPCNRKTWCHVVIFGLLPCLEDQQHSTLLNIIPIQRAWWLLGPFKLFWMCSFNFVVCMCYILLSICGVFLLAEMIDFFSWKRTYVRDICCYVSWHSKNLDVFFVLLGLLRKLIWPFHFKALYCPYCHTPVV